jgi:hypothetical protein
MHLARIYFKIKSKQKTAVNKSQIRYTQRQDRKEIQNRDETDPLATVNNEKVENVRNKSDPAGNGQDL